MADAAPNLTLDPVPSAMALASLPEPVPKGYWDLVWGQFLKNRVATFSVVTIFLLLIIAAWALLVLPLVYFRGFHSDEGVAITVARTAIVEGHWLTPYMFNA